MILTLDIGNTNIKTALFKDAEMVKYWRIATRTSYTSDEYGILLANLFTHNNVDTGDVEGICISSVVPTINFTIEHMCQNYFGKTPLWVAPGVKTGINIKYENPKELGSDRIANAVASHELYGRDRPVIYIDFGTATTFGAINEKGVFLGGCICPGIKLTSEALVSGAAKLPRFELVRPQSVINRTTVTNMQSGLLYGHIGQVSYIIQKMKEELERDDTRVIATGGLAALIVDEAKSIDIFDGLLTLKGLRLIYDKNKADRKDTDLV